jgi:hypothetical protein
LLQIDEVIDKLSYLKRSNSSGAHPRSLRETIDYRYEDRKKLARKRRHWCHLIGLDSLFQKTTITTPKK